MKKIKNYIMERLLGKGQFGEGIIHNPHLPFISLSSQKFG